MQQLLAACGWEVQAQSYSVSTTKAASPSSGKPQLSPGSPANAAAGVRVLRQPSPLGAPAAASQPQKKLLDSQQVVLKCPMCAARVGLWNYAPAGDSAVRTLLPLCPRGGGRGDAKVKKEPQGTGRKNNGRGEGACNREGG